MSERTDGTFPSEPVRYIYEIEGGDIPLTTIYTLKPDDDLQECLQFVRQLPKRKPND